MHPGKGELWLMSFLVKTELGWLHDSGAGVVVVVAIGVVLEVVGTGVVLLLEDVGAGVVVVELEVVGAGVVVVELDVVGASVVLEDDVGAGVVLEDDVGAAVVLDEDVATGVVLDDEVGAGVVLDEDVGSGVVLLDEVVASALVVVEVVAPHTGPMTCPGSVCTEPPHDEHHVRSRDCVSKQKWSIAMTASGDACWHSRLVMVKLKWHQVSATLSAGIPKMTSPEVWFQSPATDIAALQPAHSRSTLNVATSLAVLVPVAPETVTREALEMPTLVVKFTEMTLRCSGYGVECFQEAAVMVGLVILRGGESGEPSSWSAVRLGIKAPWSQPAGIFLALTHTGCAPWPHRGLVRPKQKP